MNEHDTQPGQPPAPERPAAIGAAINWLRDLMLSVVIAVLVILFVYQPVKVEGTSMMPALEDQERIFINKFVYRFGMGDIQRGDTVVFWYPNDPSKSYIKRVVGLPGDRIEVQEGAGIVNGAVMRRNTAQGRAPRFPAAQARLGSIDLSAIQSGSRTKRKWP